MEWEYSQGIVACLPLTSNWNLFEEMSCSVWAASPRSEGLAFARLRLRARGRKSVFIFALADSGETSSPSHPYHEHSLNFAVMATQNFKEDL